MDTICYSMFSQIIKSQSNTSSLDCTRIHSYKEVNKIFLMHSRQFQICFNYDLKLDVNIIFLKIQIYTFSSCCWNPVIYVFLNRQVRTNVAFVKYHIVKKLYPTYFPLTTYVIYLIFQFRETILPSKLNAIISH